MSYYVIDLIKSKAANHLVLVADEFDMSHTTDNLDIAALVSEDVAHRDLDRFDNGSTHQLVLAEFIDQLAADNSTTDTVPFFELNQLIEEFMAPDCVAEVLI